MYRKYISSVAPLADYILQVDFVSGSRLLLDMKPYRDKFRFQSIFQPQVWNSAVTNGIFCPLRRRGAQPRRDFSHGRAGALTQCKEEYT